MPKAIDPEERLKLLNQWADYIDHILKAYRWRPTDLADKLQVGRDTVCRWMSRELKTGNLPTASAQTLLKQLARERGLHK
jgi:hypothetical protein